MKRRSSLDCILDILVVALSLLALALVVAAVYQFNNTKAVYQGF